MKFILRLSFFFVTSLLILEVLLHSPLLPASNRPYSTTEPSFALPVFDTNLTRDGLCTGGKLAQHRVLWHVNNQGFIFRSDYVPASQRKQPCIAIIGDSYIVAFLVSNREHLATVLQEKVNNEYAVYSLGVESAALAEYLQIARYAAKNYNPSILVIIVNRDDALESLRNFLYNPGMLQFAIANDSITEIPPIRMTFNPITRKLRNSALARYLTINRDLRFLNFARLSRFYRVDDNSIDSVTSQNLQQRISTSIVRKLVAENPERKILFVVDADRNAIYDSFNQPPPIPEYDYLINACKGTDCVVLDLSESFTKEFLQHHDKINFDEDYHWNALGHKVVADAVYEKLRTLGWLSEAK